MILVGCATADQAAIEQPADPPAAEQPVDPPPVDPPAEDESSDDQPAATTDGEGPLIAYINKDLSLEWFQDVSAAMRETVMERGARDFLLYDVEMSPDAYITALDTVLAMGVDILIVCPPDQGLSQLTVDRAEAAGVRLMYDADPLIDEDGNHLAPGLELDAFVVGLDAGQWLGDYVVDNDVITDPASTGLMLITISEISTVIPRTEGALERFMEIVPDFPDENVFQSDYDGSTEDAFNVASALITANPNIETWLVSVINDEGAVGATRALEQAGLDSDAVVVGMGANLFVYELERDFSAFKAASYFSPVLNGQIVGNAAMDWWDYDLLPFEEYRRPGMEHGIYPLSGIMVDATNYRDIMGRFN